MSTTVFWLPTWILIQGYLGDIENRFADDTFKFRHVLLDCLFAGASHLSYYARVRGARANG